MKGLQEENLSGFHAAIYQVAERQTDDLKVPGSIPGRGTFSIAL